ncbi:reductase [Alteromonas australica]|jgi:ferredoxin, 2Fe-2S|uniref:(2Fe-2S)-binding protein n=1 Tax=Alteromonas australica TaxID=589873 RepID=A0A075P659_9ALTE|nr:MULTISPECIES: (2Fe-2S)-binding protein [Alteromonas]MAB92237.1 (2Fe-2S)-binding protein [Alteromonas sp.]AIG00406.1 reductase [Alteromonas australica]AJP45332.1 reductase [Alteromonas australica]MAF70609.1 (2Fe-2S)-binding protein [Alteromonas sp.]MAF72016.1 (2Fe-2S)-binding protein [Alteromonas sp.]|tara:strand:+ start:162 stop:485 length:324 start_codon:yes stop_codon:yes gene_type:complete
MPNVTFILPDESEVTVEALAGDSLMQTAVDNGIEEITADCGGCCSCATCHCFITPAWQGKVSPADDMEQALLETAIEDVQPNSRLSCQITLDDSLDGLVVKVPQSDW